MESNKIQYVHRNIPKQKTSEKTKNGVRQKKGFYTIMYNKICAVRSWGVGGGSEEWGGGLGRQ